MTPLAEARWNFESAEAALGVEATPERQARYDAAKAAFEAAQAEQLAETLAAARANPVTTTCAEAERHRPRWTATERRAAAAANRW